MPLWKAYFWRAFYKWYKYIDLKIWKWNSVMSNSLWPHVLYSPRNSPGQNTRVGSLSLLQGIFPTQGSNPGLLHCRRILCKLSHKGRAKWVAYPFPRGSSLLRNWTRVSCIAGGFFTNWAIGEDPKYINKYLVVYKQITLKHMSYENFIY